MESLESLGIKMKQRGAGVILCAFLLVSLVGPAAAAPAAPTEPVRLLTSGPQGVTVELTAPATGLSFKQDAGCEIAQLPGFTQTAEPGQPQLPVKVVLLGVPPDVELSLIADASAPQRAAEGFVPCAPLERLASEAEGAEDTSATAQAASVQSAWPTEAVRMIDLGFMRSQRIVRLEFYPFRLAPGGRLMAMDRITATVRFGNAPAASATASAITEPNLESVLARTLLNYESARSWRAESAAAPAAAWTPPQPGYKVEVKEDGLYRLTRAELAAAGLPVDQLDPRGLRMFNAGQEIAIRVTGEGDARLDADDTVLFFGQATSSRYTDRNVYWLAFGGGAGKRMTGRAANPAGSLASSFTATVRKEENTVYDSDLPKLPGYDHWYGQLIQALGAGKSGSVSVTMPAPQLATGSANAKLDLVLGAVTSGSHKVRLYVNPTTNAAHVWEGTWEGPTTTAISAPFPQTHLTAGNNTVKIEVINDFPGRAADLVRVDWVQLGYPRQYVADNDRLAFGGDAAGAWRYAVTGFSETPELYDVTDPLNPQLLAPVGSSAAQEGFDAVTLSFGDNQPAPRRYLALTAARRLVPPGVTFDQPSNLQATNQGADYLIITHRDFAAALAPLAQLRSAAGLRVKVVDVQDAYDEFGGGLMSAEAIRDFIAYAYANWTKPAPSSVLLVGDGTYDLRGYRSTTPTYLPPFLDMVDPDVGETATDNRYVAVTQTASGYDILPDLSVGRLPANTPAEASVMVDKIIAYATQASGSWQRQVLFVADDLEGGGGNFYAYSDGIADGKTTHNGATVKVLPASYTPKKVYLGQTCDLSNPASSSECRGQIVDSINSGALMVSYVGHGVKTYWAAERLYDVAAMTSLTNAGRLPIMLPMTCNEGYFIDPTESSLSELSLRRADGGSIASWSPTGYGLAPGHDYLERGLFLSVFHDGQSLGAGATSAKLYLAANAPPGAFEDLIDTFLLLGDPELRIPTESRLFLPLTNRP